MYKSQIYENDPNISVTIISLDDLAKTRKPL